MSGIQGVRALIYLDGISVYGGNLQEHNGGPIEVFDRIREHLDKYEFLKEQEVY
jgi:hypothetical protein